MLEPRVLLSAAALGPELAPLDRSWHVWTTRARRPVIYWSVVAFNGAAAAGMWVIAAIRLWRRQMVQWARSAQTGTQAVLAGAVLEVQARPPPPPTPD